MSFPSVRRVISALAATVFTLGVCTAGASAQIAPSTTLPRSQAPVLPPLKPGPATPPRAQRPGQPQLPPTTPPPPFEPRQPTSPAPASISTYLTYHVGYTQTSPHIYVVFWGNWTSTGDIYNLQNYLWRFYAGVGGSSWNQIVTQYGYSCGSGGIGCASGVRITNPTGQAKNWVRDTSFIPAHPTVANLQAEAQKAANYFGDRSVNAQYVIALARGHVDQTSLAGDCAWHNYTWSNGYPISYTSLPYNTDLPTCGENKVNSGSAGTLDGVSIIAGHEYDESETDPFLNAWYDSNKDEDADKCLQWSLSGYFRDLSFSTGAFAVQPTFSNYHLQTYGAGCRFY